MNKKITSYFIIGTFVTLYLMVSLISTIHVIDFFKLSNPSWLAITLAIAFEVGAAASLASIIVLEKMNKPLIWSLFIILTGMQAMGNTYYAFVNLGDFSAWSELFDLADEDVIFQKRVLSIISGAILPVVALGFIKSLVDYLRPSEEVSVEQQKLANMDMETPEEDISSGSLQEDEKKEKKVVTKSEFPNVKKTEATNSPSVVTISPEHFSLSHKSDLLTDDQKTQVIPKRYPENL